jgi:glycosyltransferase involved in cell wall biosynthesis
LYGGQGTATDALVDHSRQLVATLRAEGIDAELRLRSEPRPWVDHGAHTVFLQYNPFSYGRWGFAPSLIAALWRLRLRRRTPGIAVMVHEPYVPMTTGRSVLMGLWQRFQLRLLAGAADWVFCSTERFVEMLVAGHYSRHVRHLPVGSTLPDMRSFRVVERERLGIPDDGLIIAMLGTGHPSRLAGHLERAVNAITAHRERVTVLNLGDGAPALPGLSSDVRIHAPGRQPADALARQLASADLFLAPFVDGVSTRRTSVMAALQHAVPIVGTHGSTTDDLLRQTDALCLVPAERADRFADAAVELALDSGRRRALGSDGRRLYERCLDWPIIARSLTEAIGLDEVRASASS